jgi:hypothetical protein
VNCHKTRASSVSHNNVSRQVSASRSPLPHCPFRRRFDFGNVTAVTALDVLCGQYISRISEAAKRRKNAAHGVSRGYARSKGEPQRGERLCLIHLRLRGNIIKNIRFKKSFWRSSKRITWPTTRNTCGASFCRPAGLLVSHHHPRLTLWAAFWRRFAAGQTQEPDYCSISDKSPITRVT